LLTGGTLVSEEKGINVEDFNETMFGESDKVIVSHERTTIMGGKGNKKMIEKRIERLKEQAEEVKQEVDEKDLLDRVAKLVGGIAVIYVGANTEVEVNEKKDRIDDALSATKAAVEEGVVAGGGVTLIETLKVLNDIEVVNRDQQLGLNILKKALKYPMYHIAENSGLQGDKVIKKATTLGYPYGYDAKENTYVNMLIAGIIDPKKVTRVALESASSIATLLLTTEATISKIKGNE